MNEKVLLLLAAQGDPKKAAEIKDFLGETGESATTPANAAVAPVSVPAGDELADGIYLVFGGQSPAAHQLYLHGTTPVTDWMKEHCTGVAVKMGEKAVTVGLFDLQDGADLRLTVKDSPKDYDPAAYKDTYEDAGADWDGKGNTERVLAAGILNDEISDCLLDGQYVPAMGEMLFIHLFRKELNQAIKAVGGDELRGWHWTSAEFSATYAWLLNLTNGFMAYYTKATITDRVRPVSAFIS